MGAMLGGQRREASVLMEDGLRRSGGRGGADPLGSRETRDGQGKALGQRTTGGLALPLPGPHCPCSDVPLLFPPIHPPPP